MYVYIIESDVRVRLVGGSNKAEGRVEVLIAGEWGTACDHNWDMTEAMVVCRMLGYEGAVRAVGSAFFGPGTGEIVLHGTRCFGNETNIAQCPNRFPHDCTHFDDGGVICLPGMVKGGCTCINVKSDDWGISNMEIIYMEKYARPRTFVVS